MTTTPPPTYVERPCRACRGPLDLILDLGRLRVSTFPLPTDPAQAAVPLTFTRCAMCGLVQLQHTVDPDLLYRAHYWYRSGVNETMRTELHSVADDALRRVRLDRSDVVVDIGANDGTLLQRYHDYSATIGVLRIGFEPAVNLTDGLRPCCEVLVNDFFPGAGPIAQTLLGRAKIITSIAMVYDVDDLGGFFDAVRQVLHPEGIWIVQFQDLAQMLQTTAFDNICHEHLTYYSLKSFEQAIQPYGLTVVDVERRAINGGSLRLVVKHNDPTTSTTVGAELRVRMQLTAEEGCDDWSMLERFAWRVGETRKQLTAAVEGFIEKGLDLDLYAASTKANTLLQVCGFDETVLRQAWERSPEKWGRTTITGIPIVSEEEGRQDPPAVLLLGAWQFKEAFIQREHDFLAAGGVMFVPLPAVEIVSMGMGGRTVHGFAG